MTTAREERGRERRTTRGRKSNNNKTLSFLRSISVCNWVGLFLFFYSDEVGRSEGRGRREKERRKSDVRGEVDQQAFFFFHFFFLVRLRATHLLQAQKLRSLSVATRIRCQSRDAGRALLEVRVERESDTTQESERAMRKREQAAAEAAAFCLHC